MQPLFEMLENRTMFSAAPLFTHHVGAIMPAVHTTVPLKNSATTALHFTGTVTNSSNKSTGLTIDLTPRSNGGYTGTAVHTNSDGSLDKYQVTLDATGHMVLNVNQPNSKLHVDAQLSTDGQTITGTFTSSHSERGQTYTDQGTLTLTLANPSPAPSPTPVPAAGHFTGLATDADGTQSSLTLDLIRTKDGSLFGTVKHYKKNGAFDESFTVKFDSTGKFNYTGNDNSTAPKAGGLIVTGQMNTPRNAITGSYSVTNGDGKVTTGTFSLTLGTNTTTRN